MGSLAFDKNGYQQLPKMILILLASTLLQLCTGQNLVADLHISEHGAEYNERVEYDPITKAVTYQVPKHNDIVASTTIIHKPTDTMVEFDPEAKTCTLRSVPEGFDPDMAVIHAFSLSVNNKTVTPADAVHVFQLNHRKGLISEQRRRSLLESMQELCKDVDIEEIVAIRVSEEEFLQRSVDPTRHHSNSTRVKRRITNAFFTCDDTADRCTAMNIGRKCIWYKIKRFFSGTGEDGFHTVGDFSEEYQLEHVRSGYWSCLRCCKARQNGPMCRCSD